MKCIELEEFFDLLIPIKTLGKRRKIIKLLKDLGINFQDGLEYLKITSVDIDTAFSIKKLIEQIK